MPLFERRNVNANISKISEAADHERVYSIEFFCATYGSNIYDDFVDTWLVRALFCVVKFSNCEEHIVH
jgi:hypothetical protein